MVIPAINKNVSLVVLERNAVFQIYTLKYLWIKFYVFWDLLQNPRWGWGGHNKSVLS